MNTIAPKEEFIKTLLSESPVPCNFKVGDKVTFTNEYGTIYKNVEIIGFTKPTESMPDRFIHLDVEAYWFPVNVKELSISNDLYTKDMILTNNQVAHFVCIDYWGRAIYELEDETKVCYINMKNTPLHTINNYGEPMFPLNKEFQPKTV